MQNVGAWICERASHDGIGVTNELESAFLLARGLRHCRAMGLGRLLRRAFQRVGREWKQEEGAINIDGHLAEHF